MLGSCCPAPRAVDLIGDLQQTVSCWLLETCGLSAGAYRSRQALGANAATDPSSEIWDTPSSVVPQAWADSLRRHPDKRFTAWLLRGLSEGFRIGYGGSGKRARASRNLQSTREHPAIVDEYLNGEITAGRVVGPVPDAQTHLVRLSPFGVIPKSGQPGRWRLMVDLSSPRGSSVNQ